jgi:hypothetical protein
MEYILHLPTMHVCGKSVFGSERARKMRCGSDLQVDDAWLCFAWIITGNELIARALAIYMLDGAAAFFCVFTVLALGALCAASVLGRRGSDCRPD